MLIVGVYGTGKTSGARRRTSWRARARRTGPSISTGSVVRVPDQAHEHEWLDPVALSNLETMVRNYLAAGVDHVVLAGSV